MLPVAPLKPKKALPRFHALFAYTGFLMLAALIIGLRTFALSSDPYKRLDWSSGLLTDEGFYLHNARNLVLFGRERTDAFNNSLLSPVLNAIQIVVFRQFGAGIVSARSISVAAGLLTLPLFFAALRRAYNLRAAALATVFLGLDHLPLLYGRMALMDTPAALVLVAAFYCWVRAHPPQTARSKFAPLFWLILCGASLGLAFATRGLCAFAIPVPLLILCRVKRGESAAFNRLFAFVCGLAAVLILYVVLWAAPHHAELTRINAFYLKNQLLPHSFRHFLRIVTRSFFGDTRGIAPALIRHTPVLFGLALAGVAWRVQARRTVNPLSKNSLFLGGWLLSGLSLFAVVGYSPSRYYILFFPALAAIAALTCLSASKVARFLLLSNRTRTLFGGFFAYHLFLFARPFDGLPGNIFVGALTLCASLCFWFLPIQRKKFNASPKSKIQNPTRIQNSKCLAGSPGAMERSQRALACGLADASRVRAARRGALADGAFAARRRAYRRCRAGNERQYQFYFRSRNPGLCNDHQPLERFANRTRAILILDGPRREAWWDAHYPAQVAPSNRAVYFPDAVGFPVGVYLVPPELPKNKARLKQHLKPRPQAGNRIEHRELKNEETDTGLPSRREYFHR